MSGIAFLVFFWIVCCRCIKASSSSYGMVLAAVEDHYLGPLCHWGLLYGDILSFPLNLLTRILL